VKPNAESRESDELYEHPLYTRVEAFNDRIAIGRVMQSNRLQSSGLRLLLGFLRTILQLLFILTTAMVPCRPDIGKTVTSEPRLDC